jgi:hypothetical protein
MVQPAPDSYSAATKHTQETSPSEGVTVARSYRPRLRTDRPLSAASKPTEELYSAACLKKTPPSLRGCLVTQMSRDQRPPPRT